MEKQAELPIVYPRLFNEESWRDLLPEAVQRPLRRAAHDFFQFAVVGQEDKSERTPQLTADAFSRQLNAGCKDILGEKAISLSQAETDYGVLLMKLVSIPSGSGRDGLLRDLTLAREKLIRKEERAPATTAARSLAEKIGWRGVVGKLQPGSSDERLGAIEQSVLGRLGYGNLRSLFESQTETPQQILEKFVGKKMEEILGGEEPESAGEDGEVVLPEKLNLLENISSKLSRWLKQVDWKFVGRGSASMLAGVGLSELLGSASWVGGMLLGVNMLLRRVKGAEKVEEFIKSREAKYPKASERIMNRVVMGVAMGELKAAQAALKVIESPEAMFVGAGLIAGAGIRQVRGLVDAARPIVPTEAQAGQAEVGGAGGETGRGLPRLPPAEPTGPQHQGEGRLPGGETAVIPPEDLLPQPGDAELIAAQQAEAARQAAELQAATPVGLTGQELAGGTIWGNELDFAKQQGVYHVEPAANLLKGFARLVAQPQPPTEIGPSDTAYLVNRDVAEWAVKQLDILYRMDPSTMNSWQKALWEIGRGLRPAGWQDLQAVTEEYVRSTINH